MNSISPIVIASIVICMIGLALHMWSPSPKVAQVGGWMFWVGLLATLMRF